ncbi:MAG TPA: hypothetical protein GX715_00895 [Armatimonadetes bacterium]|jgi:hypothetical protein|nr:hypothetical protein [Armatimonadota bacterium]
MKRTLEKAAWAFAGSVITLGIALTCGVATGQQPPAGPPGQGRPGGARGFVTGTVVQTDLQHNAVQVNTPQGQRWVQLPQGVMITKRETIALKDLAVGETITVGGVPAEILADSLEIVPASPATPGAAAAPGAGAAPGVPAGQGFPGRDRPQVRAMVTGTVAGVNPLVVTGPDGAKVTIITNEQTKVSRRKQIGVQELVEGEHFAAFGQPDARDVVQARTAVTGASQEDVQTLMREVGRDAMGFRAPRGGEGGRPGGRRPGGARGGARGGGAR